MYFEQDGKRFFIAGRSVQYDESGELTQLPEMYFIKKKNQFLGWDALRNIDILVDRPVDIGVKMFDSKVQAETFKKKYLDDSYRVEPIGIKIIICPDYLGSGKIKEEKCVCDRGVYPVFEYTEDIENK